jgi:ribonuclease HI
MALAFVDDTAYVAVAKTFQETHEILTDMMERNGGGYQWSRQHNSRFETSKFALMDFTRSKTKERGPITLDGVVIQPSHHTRFLGIIIDEELTWKEHAAYAIAKGTEYVLQIRRLSKTSMGIPTKLMRQLYQSVAIPKFTYGANIWFKPLLKDDTTTIQRGSKGVADRLTSIQRIAALSITGAMRTSPTDSLEAHANLLPIPILMQKICHCATVRLASLPQTHPLHRKLCWIANHNVRHHRSSLHNLLHTFRVFPNNIETIDPTRIVPTRTKAWKTRIAKTKQSAIREQKELKDTIQIFSDGSGYEGGIGAAAVLIRNGQEPRMLRYHLGTDEEHTVFEGEMVGLTLAVHLLATEENITYPTSILVDNQAAIQTDGGTGSNYLANQLDRLTKRLRTTHRRQGIGTFELTIRWIPGHMDVQGNELADKEAKEAARGMDHESPHQLLPKYLRGKRLLRSASALTALQKTKSRTLWKSLWEKSPRYARTRVIDPTMPSDKYIKLTNGLPKRTASFYIQMRTRHVPLNFHLHRIKKSDTPRCPICPEIDETIHHYLFDCPQYRRERHLLSNALGRNATSLTYILTSEKATPHLVRFINCTGRFKPTFGEI